MSIDFTIMYATHDAFRRDLTRLATAAAAGHADAPGIHAGWANFTRQLHVHHTVEDAAAIQRAVLGTPIPLAGVVEALTETDARTI
ncbi:hypothetical protein IU470_26580 [Nocardia abscessus]|uniref:Hemerythrin-like domain-containing protein n=1 Tax=Nocardia abscessus TaxID=120957 RepID=A0ABS0CE78_9NOCA|nr:hypothetical protein [Nocardia abscessus]MBF6228660.1 hypothetical protein [Nocardia abscessus]